MYKILTIYREYDKTTSMKVRAKKSNVVTFFHFTKYFRKERIKMNKKTKRRGNLKYSLLLLLLLAILLVTSTYAWFTANKTVTISELQVNVQAKNGLQISTDAINWKAVLSNDDITGVAYEGCINQIPATMEPVSTAGNVTSGNLDLFYGTVNPGGTGEYELTATKEADATKGTNGKYVAYDIYLKVDTPSNLKLTTASNVLSPTNSGLQNSSRVAFLIQGHAATGTDATTLYTVNNGTADELHIWEPNNDTHSAAAVQHAFSTYGVTINQTDVQQAYDGIKAQINTGIQLKQANATKNDTYFARVTPKISTATTFADNQEMFTLQAGVTKVRIYIWIEGQDLDCENNASGSEAQFNLQFTVAED